MGGSLRLAILGAVVCAPALAQGEWKPLFDGRSLEGWRETPFTGQGTVSVKDGVIILGAGYMTGVTWTGDFPKSNYEIRFEAARLQGSDFFAAVTFPVKDSFCTWVNGGWGGAVVGLSSLDDQDASENETAATRDFQRGRWYAFRLVVSDSVIEGWIDGEQVIGVDISGRKVSLRWGEIELSKPLGFASYSTVGGVRKVEYRLRDVAGTAGNRP